MISRIVTAAIAALLAYGWSITPTLSADDTQTEVKDLLVAGGCFWCVEADLEKVPGVIEVVSGYAGGDQRNPSYRTYSKTGHREVALVRYDAQAIDFETLMNLFVRTIDVTDDGGQFCDRGYGYTSAVYFADESQKALLEGIIKEGEDVIGQPIVTPIEPRPEFFPAEDYHQDYYKRNKLRYSTYRSLCGRDRTVRSVWGQSGPETIARFKDQS